MYVHHLILLLYCFSQYEIHLRWIADVSENTPLASKGTWVVSAAKDFLVAPLAYLSASGEQVSKHLTNGWNVANVEILEDRPLSIPLMEGVRIRWEVKVKNHNRLRVIIKFIPSGDMCEKFIAHVAQLQERLKANIAKIKEGVDASEDLASLEAELQQSTKAMQDLQAERDAKRREPEARVRQKDTLKTLCDLFSKPTPSSRQKVLGPRKWKFGVGSKFVARTHARTHAHTQNNKHARQGK